MDARAIVAVTHEMAKHDNRPVFRNTRPVNSASVLPLESAFPKNHHELPQINPDHRIAVASKQTLPRLHVYCFVGK